MIQAYVATCLIQFNSVQNTLLSVAVITIKRKYFFVHTSSATLNDNFLPCLQVRGFLSIHRKFPLSVSEAKRTTLQQFQALVKAAYRQSGDRGVVKRQRQLALQEAYHNVPRSLLAQVQRYVAEDCELFGYDCSIESRFNVSDKPEPVFHLDQLL